jgi:hypothetical protein
MRAVLENLNHKNSQLIVAKFDMYHASVSRFIRGRVDWRHFPQQLIANWPTSGGWRR